MKKKIIIALAIFSLAFSLSAMTSESYENGDSIFSLSVGTSFNPTVAWFNQDNSKNMKTLLPGGNGSISFMYLLKPSLRIGGEIGYYFNYTQKSTLLKRVPLTFNLAWGPRYKFVDFPLTLKVGGSYLSHGDYHYFAPIISFNYGIDFYINQSWGLGLESGIKAIGEFYSTNSKNNNVMFTIPLTINVKFRR